MAEQIPDGLYYDRELYHIVRVKGKGLIYPQEFGMETYAPHTACWRGYISFYSVLESRLILKDMDVSTDAYRPINGIVADESGLYSNLNMDVRFTGGILAGIDHISEMGRYYSYPHSYAKLMEFCFDNGGIKSINDHSERMAELRKKIRQQQAWDAEHRAELDEIGRLRKHLDELKKSIPISNTLFASDEPDANLSEEKIAIIKESIQAEMLAVQTKIQTLSTVFYPPWDEGSLMQWYEETFVLDYYA